MLSGSISRARSISGVVLWRPELNQFAGVSLTCNLPTASGKCPCLWVVGRTTWLDTAKGRGKTCVCFRLAPALWILIICLNNLIREKLSASSWSNISAHSNSVKSNSTRSNWMWVKWAISIVRWNCRLIIAISCGCGCDVEVEVEPRLKQPPTLKPFGSNVPWSNGDEEKNRANWKWAWPMVHI